MSRKSKRNDNGNRNHDPGPSPSLAGQLPCLSKISVSKEERDQIAALDKNLASLKMALADTAMQAEAVEQKQKKILAAIEEAQKSFTTRVIASAKEHGINTDDKSQRWNFDATEMAFSRTA